MALSKQIIEEEAFKLVMSTKKHFEQLRIDNGLVEKWKSYERSYFNDTDDFYKGLAKVRVPALHQAVERIVPKMDKVIFPPDGDFFEATPKDHNDDLSWEDAEAVTNLIKQQFRDVSVRSKMIGIYRSLCIYGTVFITTYWDKKKKERYKRVNGQRTKVWETLFDNPDFYAPSIWDIYIDPKDENLEGALIERVVKNYHELYSLRERTEEGEKIGIYKNVDKLKEKILVQEKDADKIESDEAKGIGNHKYGPHEKKIEVFRFWGDIPKWFVTGLEEDREEQTVCNGLIEVGVVGDCGVVLRIIDNPFDHQEKPYLRGRYIRVDGQAYGLGVMSVNIPMEAELNTLRTQLMDLRTFILKKKWLRNRDANIDDRQLKDLENLVIDTDDINGIRDVAPQDFSPSAGMQEEKIKQDIEDGTGASKLLGGTPTGSSLDRTAAGIATVVQGGLERFELVVTQFEEDVLKPLVRHFWMLDQQFLPDGRDVELVGKGIVKVTPDLIPLDGMDLNFRGLRELGEKEFKINALNILLQNLTPYIQYGLDPIPVVLRFFKLTGMGDLEKEVDVRSSLEDTPQGELQLLMMGKNVKINLNDNHDAYLAAYRELLAQPDLPDNVKKNTLEAVGQRLMAKQILETGFKPSGTQDVA